MLINLLYLFIGAIGGTIIGAIGTGSSLIILPTLTLIFSKVHPEAVAIKMAVATCLATLVVGSISGASSYFKSGIYDKKLVKACLPGVLAGAIIAPLISSHITADWLKLYIGILITGIAVYKLIEMFIKKEVEPKEANSLHLFLVSMTCTTLSGLAGVALGILMIPYLGRYSKHQVALGTNLVLAVPYSIVGTAGYIIAGMKSTVSEIDYTLGYIYLPTFIAISITMAIFPPVGLKLVKNIGNLVMQRVFYTYLLFAGISILI